MIEFDNVSASLGVQAPIKTRKFNFKNLAVSGTNLTAIGYVYALDTKRAGSGVDTQAEAWRTIVALDATNIARGFLVVAEEAKLTGNIMRGVVHGRCKAYCYGAISAGLFLKPDSSNGYFVTTTDKTDVRGMFDGAAQTATNALNLVDVVLFNDLPC